MINKGFTYDQKAGYWLDKESEFIIGPLNDAINAIEQGNGSIQFYSEKHFIKYNIDYVNHREPFTIWVRFNLKESAKAPQHLSIIVLLEYVYTGNRIKNEVGFNEFELYPEFLQVIDVLSKELWSFIKPIYGKGGGDDYISDYQPTISDMKKHHVPMLFPINFFSKDFVDSIGEQKILNCRAEKIFIFPDKSIMIWPTKNPVTGGGPRKIAPFEKALGIKHEKWILGQQLSWGG